MRKLNDKEELLIELVHLLSYGSPKDLGLSLKELKYWLTKPIPTRENRNALECLETDGRAFLNELITFLNSRRA
jgi:hypothetical protein